MALVAALRWDSSSKPKKLSFLIADLSQLVALSLEEHEIHDEKGATTALSKFFSQLQAIPVGGKIERLIVLGKGKFHPSKLSLHIESTFESNASSVKNWTLAGRAVQGELKKAEMSRLKALLSTRHFKLVDPVHGNAWQCHLWAISQHFEKAKFKDQVKKIYTEWLNVKQQQGKLSGPTPLFDQWYAHLLDHDPQFHLTCVKP